MRAQEFIVESIIFQGYRVDINQSTNELVVSKNGRVLHRERTTLANRGPNDSKIKSRLSRIIDQIEDEKYPDDLELREADLPPKAMQQLYRLKYGLNEPGIQLTQPKGPQQPKAADPVPTAVSDPEQGIDISGDYPTLKARLEKMERLASMAQKIEQLKDRLERKRFGIDRGLAADLELLSSWPVPRTDVEIDDLMNKFTKVLNSLQSAISVKRSLWR